MGYGFLGSFYSDNWITPHDQYFVIDFIIMLLCRYLFIHVLNMFKNVMFSACRMILWKCFSTENVKGWCAFWIKKLMRKITELLIISDGVMPSLLCRCEQDYRIVMSSNHTSILSMWPLEYSAKIQAISPLGRPGNTRKQARAIMVLTMRDT